MIRRRTLAAALALAFASSLGSLPLRAQQTERAKQIGGKFMCMCGCNQVLTQCNHINCPSSVPMLKKVDQAVARGDSETAITETFVQEYGTEVYAEPPKTGLSLVAWVLPSIYLLLGTLLVIFVIWRWRSRTHSEFAGAGNAPAISAEDLARARRRVAQETED
jgi:cytochrome c-type biogenesis protein CcmH